MAEKREVPYKEFGERLVYLREGIGMTKQDLAEKCGIAPSTMINYERGLRIPYADTALKMAETLGVSVEELIGGENPELAMAQEKGLDRMRSVNGSAGALQLRRMHAENSKLAGGELSEEQLWEMQEELNKVALLVQQKLREKYTSPKYKGTVERKREMTNDIVDDINKDIVARTSGE